MLGRISQEGNLSRILLYTGVKKQPQSLGVLLAKFSTLNLFASIVNCPPVGTTSVYACHAVRLFATVVDANTLARIGLQMTSHSLTTTG